MFAVAKRLTILAAALAVAVHADATQEAVQSAGTVSPSSGSASASTSSTSTVANWVYLPSTTDSACYRKTHIMKTCPVGYNSDNIATCWAQCPIEYPIECGMECIPQNDDCTLEIVGKVTSVATVALNAATSGVFGQISAASKAVQTGVKCAQKLLSVTQEVVGYAEELQVQFPNTTESQLLYLLNHSDFALVDVPLAVTTCLGLEVPSQLTWASEVVDVVEKILVEVIQNGSTVIDTSNFFSYISNVGLDTTITTDQDAVDALTEMITSGQTCGTQLQSLINKVTKAVTSMKTDNANAIVADIRLALSNSDLFLKEIPTVTNQCVQNLTTDAYATRDTLRAALEIVTDKLIESSSTDDKILSTVEYIAKVADLGLDVIAMFDPTGIADMLSEFIQPICGPTAFIGDVDDGTLAEALALKTMGNAFTGSYGTWTQSGDGVVTIIFESTDNKDVTVNIHSGGQQIKQVKVAKGKTVTWTSTVAELQDKTLYLDRWRPGFLGIPGTGGGSLNMWIPRSASGGHLELHAKINVS
jgi:hypothetical protein